MPKKNQTKAQLDARLAKLHEEIDAMCQLFYFQGYEDAKAEVAARVDATYGANHTKKDPIVTPNRFRGKRKS